MWINWKKITNEILYLTNEGNRAFRTYEQEDVESSPRDNSIQNANFIRDFV